MSTRTKPADLTRLAEVFHALSDPTRLGVVDLLRGGERCVCELVDELDTAQSRLSFHLRVLKEAGILMDRRDGRWMYYRLNPDRVEELSRLLADCSTRARSWVPVGCCS